MLDGYLHAIPSFIHTLYPFLFQNRTLDYIFLFIAFGIPFSWTLFKGECVISLLFKKIKDPNYVTGSHIKSNELDDVYSMVGDHRLISGFMVAILLSGVILVLARQHFPMPMLFVTFPLWITYCFVVFWQNPTLNLFFSFVFGSILVFISYKWMK